MARFIWIRHGQASFLSDDYDRLSDLGHVQGAAVGEYIADQGLIIDRVVMGPNLRHRQTYEAACTTANLPSADIFDGLAEYDFEQILTAGVDDPGAPPELGKALDFLATSDDKTKAIQEVLEIATAAWVDGNLKTDESWLQFKTRVLAALNSIYETANQEKQKSVAIFSSGGPIGIATGDALGLPDQKIMSQSWLIRNASITEIMVGRGKRSLASFSEQAYLSNHQRSWR